MYVTVVVGEIIFHIRLVGKIFRTRFDLAVLLCKCPSRISSFVFHRVFIISITYTRERIHFCNIFISLRHGLKSRSGFSSAAILTLLISLVQKIFLAKYIEIYVCYRTRLKDFSLIQLRLRNIHTVYYNTTQSTNSFCALVLVL